MRVRILLLVLASLGCASCEVSLSGSTAVGVSAPPPPRPGPPALEGWTIGESAQRAYVAEVDPGIERDGHPTVSLHTSSDPYDHHFGIYTTSLDAVSLRGRRVRASVWVRTAGESPKGSFWIRARGADKADDSPSLASATQRLIPSTEFTRHQVELIVPEETCSLQLGLGIAWPAGLWMDGVTVEAL